MNIGDAMMLALNGKKIHRRTWDSYRDHFPGEYRYLAITEPTDEYEPFICAVLWNGRKAAFNPSHSQLLANDWEEYLDSDEPGEETE